MTPMWADVDSSESPHNHLFGFLNEFIYYYYYAGNYTKLCTIQADLSGVPLLPQPKVAGQGSFYSVDCDIILLFGLTELKAQLAWQENVSRLHTLFNPIDFGLILRAAYREQRNGKFQEKKLFLLP